MLAALCVAACACGCGSTGTPDGPAALPNDRVASVDAAEPAAIEAPALADGRFPADFTLDVTVLLGPGAAERLGVQDRQAKYVLFPDGSLHSDASPFIDASTRPGRVRWLYEDQVQYLWGVCAQLGFTDADRANGPPNPDLVRAVRGERVALLTLRADGRTWTWVRRAVGDEELDAAAVRVIRALAVLSWLPDWRADDLLPERYDYGPDPYAAYRQIRDRQGVEKVR